MPIRLQLFIASFAYVAFMIGIAWFAHVQMDKSAGAIGSLSTIAIDTYDKAFEGVDYAHKVQTAFVRFADAHKAAGATFADDASHAQVQKILDNLDVMIDRAMDDKSRELSKSLRVDIAALMKLPANAPAPDLDAIDKNLDKLVDRVGAAGFAYRTKADDAVDDADKLVAYGNRTLKIVTGITLSIAVVITFLLGHLIVPPIKRAVSVANAIAEGRLDNEIKLSGKKARSEPSLLLKALSVMQSSIADNITRIEKQTSEIGEKAAVDSKRKSEIEIAVKGFEKKVDHLLQSLVNSSDTMKSSSESMIQAVEKTDSNLQQTIAKTAEVSANVSTVAAAAEELSASVFEISNQVTRSSGIAKEAAQKTTSADGTIQRLSQSTDKISSVTGLIDDIASQINMLALNATIEAARAGDAGKGFAVVASEVKSLANQTAQATETISTQITDIQDIVRSVIEALNGIRTTILQMEGISAAVAAAVEEQGSATQEIARNIQETSTKVKEVSDNIIQVGSMSKGNKENSQAVLKSATSVSVLTDSMSEEIEGFLKKVT